LKRQTNGTHTCPSQCVKRELWNQAVYTDLTGNRSDIIMKNRKGKTSKLVDIAKPTDRNVVQKEAEKKLKNKSLGIQIQ